MRKNARCYKVSQNYNEVHHRPIMNSTMVTSVFSQEWSRLDTILYKHIEITQLINNIIIYKKMHKGGAQIDYGRGID